MRPIKTLDTYVGATKTLAPEGLYSTESFGLVGSKIRSMRFSYIDLKVSIIHPTLCKALIKLRALYKDIMAGKTFAKWDPAVSDFVKSDMVDGRTGFEFFCEYLPKIVLQQNESIGRQQTIDLFNKYKNNCMLSKVLVLPAGLRDIEVDDSGRTTSDEVNDLYFKLIAISNTINASGAKANIESYNPQRISLQNTFNEIYDYFTAIVEGKKNLLMGKWASRKVFNGTRNVITAMNTTTNMLKHPGNVGFNDTLIGLYQTVKGMLPVTIFHLKTGFLDRCFSVPGAPVLLTDPITKESKRIILSTESYNQWLSTEGLEKLIAYYKEETIRHDPIMIEGNYLGLCYRGPDKTFALINGIDQLPEGRSPEDCTPITMTELLYCAIYSVANVYSGFVTRYPITGIGSVYPSKIHLKTTLHSEERTELDTDSWEPIDSKHIAYEFPKLGSSFYNSLSPHPSRIGRLGADYDGDTCSFNIVYTDEAAQECNNYYRGKRAYVGTDGKFINSTSVDTIIYVLKNITGAKKYTEETA